MIIFIKAGNRIQCLVLGVFVLTFDPEAQSLLIGPKRIRIGHAVAGTSIRFFRKWKKKYELILPAQEAQAGEFVGNFVLI